MSKAVYTVLALNLEGKKDVLGLYLSESEGANFWLSVLTDLQNRGLKDILIACVDGLTGFPDAINSIYPQTEVQLCVIHQIRNSIKYVASKHHKAFMADLKPRSQKKQQKPHWMSWMLNGGNNIPSLSKVGVGNGIIYRLTSVIPRVSERLFTRQMLSNPYTASSVN